MTEWVSTGDPKRINAKIWSGKSHPEGDYESSLTIYFGDREIGGCGDGEHEFILSGKFEFQDYNEEGPVGEETTLSLTESDIIVLLQILNDWNDENHNLDKCPRWKRVL